MKKYWVWLQLALGVGNRKTDAILQTYEDPKEFYDNLKANNHILKCFNNQEVEKLKSFSLDKVQAVLDDCEKMGITVLTPDMPNFPKRLMNIYETPCAVYVKGELGNIDDELAVSVVGTRNMTDYGAQAAFKISRDLALANVTVISGLATGIDACAHKGALSANGRTIAVLGCGVDVIYPLGNRHLYEAIEKKGILISEYPPGTKPLAYHFPWRNRIVAALSLGLLVVEAPEKSGALITTAYALEQGKDVFAVPGSIFHPNGQGTFQLLHDGATPVSCAKDIIEVYMNTFKDKIDLSKIKKSKSAMQEAAKKHKPENKPIKEENTLKEPINNDISMNIAKQEAALKELDGDYLKLYKALSSESKPMDILASELAIPVHTVASILTELEIMGYVVSHPGKRYSL